MSKFLARFVAILLVPCLLMDSNLASALSSPYQLNADASQLPKNTRFQEQALAERLGSVPVSEHGGFASRFMGMATGVWRTLTISHGKRMAFPIFPPALKALLFPFILFLSALHAQDTDFNKVELLPLLPAQQQAVVQEIDFFAKESGRHLTDAERNEFINNIGIPIVKGTAERPQGPQYYSLADSPAGAIGYKGKILIDHEGALRLGSGSGLRWLAAHEIAHYFGEEKLHVIQRDASFANGYAVVSALDRGGLPELWQALDDYYKTPDDRLVARAYVLMGVMAVERYPDPVERDRILATLIQDKVGPLDLNIKSYPVQ